MKKSTLRRSKRTGSVTRTDQGRVAPTHAFQNRADDHGMLDRSSKSWVMSEFTSKTQYLDNTLYTLKGASKTTLTHMSNAGNEYFYNMRIKAGRVVASTLAEVMRREHLFNHLAGKRRQGDFIIVDGAVFTGSKRDFDNLSWSVNIKLDHDNARWVVRSK